MSILSVRLLATFNQTSFPSFQASVEFRFTEYSAFGSNDEPNTAAPGSSLRKTMNLGGSG